MRKRLAILSPIVAAVFILSIVLAAPVFGWWEFNTTVTIDFEPHPEGTVVRLLEGTYEEGEVGNQDMLNRAGGWAQALTLMKFWVEHGLKY